MYDGITPASLPQGADLYAAYVDHNGVNTYAELAALFPGKVYVAITNWGDVTADVIDVEHDGEGGSASIATAVNWTRSKYAAGGHPTIYSDASTWPSIMAALDRASVPHPLWWGADYGDKQMLPGTVATQWATAPGYDTSQVVDYWPGVDNTPITPGDDMNLILHDGSGNYWSVAGSLATKLLITEAVAKSCLAQKDMYRSISFDQTTLARIPQIGGR